MREKLQAKKKPPRFPWEAFWQRANLFKLDQRQTSPCAVKSAVKSAVSTHARVTSRLIVMDIFLLRRFVVMFVFLI